MPLIVNLRHVEEGDVVLHGELPDIIEKEIEELRERIKKLEEK